VSLLEDVRQIAGALDRGEAPEHGETASVVGALVKVLDDAGVKVGDQLLADAKAKLAPAAAAAAAAAPVDHARLEGLIGRLEAALQVAEGKEPAAEPSKPEPTA
jgi:hypothetical protein